MLYLFGLVVAAGLSIAIAAFGGALGQGKAAAAALEGMARQPEAAGQLRSALILGLALIESLVIYTLLIAILLYLKLPATEEILKTLGP
jgi:F-type H+-transporting ATPase subunit c